MNVYRTRAIITHSWLQTALEYKPYIKTEFSKKNLLKNKELVFKNGVIIIQATGYNGARTVDKYYLVKSKVMWKFNCYCKKYLTPECIVERRPSLLQSFPLWSALSHQSFMHQLDFYWQGTCNLLYLIFEFYFRCFWSLPK